MTQLMYLIPVKSHVLAIATLIPMTAKKCIVYVMDQMTEEEWFCVKMNTVVVAPGSILNV